MSKNTWTVPMYTREFLALTDQDQSLAIFCVVCKTVCDTRFLPEQEERAISWARDVCGYKMTPEGVMCKPCQEYDRERREREAEREATQ